MSFNLKTVFSQDKVDLLFLLETKQDISCPKNGRGTILGHFSLGKILLTKVIVEGFLGTILKDRNSM